MNKRFKVLVVDDDPVNIKVIWTLELQFRLSTFEAGNGAGL